jgi:hypothetical protein
VVDLSPPFLEPLVEGIIGGSELLQGRSGVVALPIDDRHLPLGKL